MIPGGGVIMVPGGSVQVTLGTAQVFRQTILPKLRMKSASIGRQSESLKNCWV